jgi:hypothetical protein
MLPWAGRGDREHSTHRGGHTQAGVTRTDCPNCGAGKPMIIAAVLRVSPDANGPEDRFWRAADHLGFS